MSQRKPHLSQRQILAWADAHRRRTGDWPTASSGRIVDDTSRTTWTGVDDALTRGGRGLPGGTSLAKLLLERRGRRHDFMQPPLTINTVLKWADAHYARTGSWPNHLSYESHLNLARGATATDRRESAVPRRAGCAGCQ